jgi:hypothetical protein
MSEFLVLILMVIAGYVAANLAAGNGPVWPAITAYWAVLTVKNAVDLWRAKR